MMFGVLGIDRFYLGYVGIGVLKLLTGGCFGILAIIDAIRIASGQLRPADGSLYEEEIAAAPPPASDPYADLEKLAGLYREGVLTEGEYARMKADCLARIR